MREGWIKKRLTDFVWFQRGFDLPLNNFIEGNVPVYGSTSILGFHNVAKVKAPGIITGRSGTLGKFQFSNQDFWPHNTTLWVKDFKGNNEKFAYYLLKTLDFTLFNSGGAVPSLNRNLLNAYIINIPPLETQRKIAKILSNYDDLIENNLKRIKILEEMAQQTYEEWFVRIRFPGYETAKINETTGLPEGWERDLVGNQLDKIKSTTKIKSSEIQKSGLFPVIDQSRDFIAGFTDDRVAVLRYSNTPYIVFGDHTRVLKLINFDFARGADGTQIIKSKNKRMPQHLFYFTLMNIDLSNYHYARHFKYLKDSEIIIPSESIANTFEDLVKLNYDIIFNLQEQNQRLREARDILLPRLMMGLLNVEDIDL